MKKVKSALTILSVLLAAMLSLTGCGFLFDEGGGTDNGKPVSVTVTLDLNGGSGVTKLTLIGEAGSAMELPEPAREGYTFDKWYRGWAVVSQTEFPNVDMPLTARYYSETETEQTVVTIPTEVNKRYGGGSGSVLWDKDWFTAENWDKVEWLRRNINAAITVTAICEAYVTGYVSFGASGTLTLTGASSADVIASQSEIKNYDGYGQIVLNNMKTSKLLVGSDTTVIRLIYKCNLSSYLYLRDISITIEYTEPAGVLV